MEWLIVLLLCIVVLWFALRVAGDVLCLAIDLFVLTVYGLTLLIGRMIAGVLWLADRVRTRRRVPDQIDPTRRSRDITNP